MFEKLKAYLALLRVKHYIKNFIVFIPVFFAGEILDFKKMPNLLLGFLCFCLISSTVYILNDYKDIEKDKLHPTKKERPLASGKIKPIVGLILAIFFLITVILLFALVIKNLYAGIILFVYFLLNIGYSFGLKNIPILDIVILSSGFVLRVFYGGFIADVQVSTWLFLVVTSGSLFMSLGKRRNELKRQMNTRTVLKYYNESFLDKNMYVSLALTDVFYSLWAFYLPNQNFIYTVPLFIIVLMKYSLDTETVSDGDPVEVILGDKILIGLSFIYAVSIVLLIYVIK